MYQPENMFVALLLVAAAFCLLMIRVPRKAAKRNEGKAAPYLLAGIALIKASDAFDLPRHVSLRTHIICDSLMAVCALWVVAMLTQHIRRQVAERKAIQ